MASLKPTIPTLDYAGWVSDPQSVLERAFSYALLSFHSQDNIFFNKVTSLPHTFRETSVPIVISNRLREDLTNYFSNFFTNAKVDVSVKDLQNELNQYDLNVYIEGESNGKLYNAAYLLQYSDGTLPKVLSKINV